MKCWRFIIVCIMLILISAPALAMPVSALIPPDSLWAASSATITDYVGGDFTETTVGEKAAIKTTGVDVDGFLMDGYYIFTENMGTYNGLSKLTYILSDSYSSEELTATYDALVTNMSRSLGSPNTEEKSKSSWTTDHYKVEIGKGKFSKYTGNDDSSVAVVITGLNMPTPVPSDTPVPTPRPTRTPKPTRTPRPTKTPKPTESAVSVNTTAEPISVSVVTATPASASKQSGNEIGWLSAFLCVLVLITAASKGIKKPKVWKPTSQMTGVEFEQYCARYLLSHGFSRIKTTPTTGDYGADLVAYDKKGNKWVFQCKRYSGKVNNSAVQEVVAAKAHYRANYAAVMTNSVLTANARALARENGVKIYESL